MSLTLYAQAAIANYYLGDTTLAPPGTWYVGLLDAKSVELTTANALGYARVAVTNNTTNWPAGTGSFPLAKANGTSVTFAAATGTWATAVWFGLYDALTGGNLWIQGTMLAPVAIVGGNQANFPPGALVTQWS
jgi:hypothetical protein